MRRNAALFSILVISFSSGLYAKKAHSRAVDPAASQSTLPQMTGDRKVLHALNRLTFGPRESDLEAVNRTGLDKWIEAQLNPRDVPENPVLEAKLAPLETLQMSPAELVRRYPTPQMVKAMLDGKLPFPADPEARQAVEKLAARLDGTDVDEQNDRQRKPRVFNGPRQVMTQELSEGKLLRAVYSNRQLEEVLTDFWYNHFNVFLDKGADRYLVTTYERDVIRPHVLGHFKDLLLATAQSPAMLFYLDNWQSVGPDARPNSRRRQGLNENYGRELMELHTLGVDGGYTQKDVTEVARCFTGWTIRQPMRGGSFEFNVRLHDNGEKHVLGVTIPAGGGMGDGLKVIDILAHSPATARSISKSLAMRFVSDNPPDALVQRMSKSFLESDGDLREVMRKMIDSPEFWDPANFRSKVKSPLEMVASAVRAVNGDIDLGNKLPGLMNQLGEPLYRKLEPTGYSNRSTDWMNSASLLARMNFAIALARGKVSGVKVETQQFAGSPAQVEHRLLLTDPSVDAQAAIEAELSEAHAGPMVAGLTLGSPDFQRR
jgi:uncharacterized protein (DUF1800 family)